MMSLFSVFDPSTFFNMNLNWMVILMVLFLFPVMFYMEEGSFIKLLNNLILMVGMMFKEISYPNNLGVVFMCTGMFIFLSFNNLFGLFPFVFTASAHPFMTLSLGFIMWFMFFIMGWVKNMKHSAAHLVPEGCPLVLSLFLVMIESISHLIRPFTLSIRLAANMMAGHLIIGLLSSISMGGMMNLMVSIFMQSLLLILEFGVCVIQGFVFSILMLLYALEYY